MMNATPEQLSELCIDLIPGCRTPSERTRLEATASELVSAIDVNNADLWLIPEESHRTKANHLRDVLTEAKWTTRSRSGYTRLPNGKWKTAQRKWLCPPGTYTPPAPKVKTATSGTDTNSVESADGAVTPGEAVEVSGAIEVGAAHA